MITLNKLLENYKTFIGENFPNHLNNFIKNEKGNPAGARAQAVVHSLLQSNQVNVSIHEDPSTGGADLLCEYYYNKFLVEVTSLVSEAVVKKSKIPDRISNEIKAHAFSQITTLLHRKASHKANQLVNDTYPTVLAISSEHIANGVLFSNHSVKEFMTGVSKIRIDSVDNKSKYQDITELQASAFLRQDSNGNIEACRKSISAILLVQVNDDSCKTIGLLHPEPEIEFRYELLPNIPFLRIRPWPIEENKIFCEWIIENPGSFNCYYYSFKPNRIL
ncbi:MAG: hypothetical protein KDF60_04790 [Calditrichaeota bacterium]|nr:hypothetical protein [Calditrichota bacterium]